MTERKHMVTLSGAKALAAASGCEARYYDGRLFLFRDGALLGSTLVCANLAPPAEPEISRYAFDKIIAKEDAK
jgi:hypothetical protein